MDWMTNLLQLSDTVSVFEVVLLAAVSFCTSMLTAAVGLGGGMVLLAVMAQILPAAAIVPVHGAIQWGSNFGRAVLLRPYMDWRLVLYFLSGSVVGAFLGGQVVVSLPVAYIQLILASFILYATWGPKPSLSAVTEKSVLMGGLLSTMLTMFVGATGPFVSVILKRMELGKYRQVATMSGCLVVQHSLKVLVFALLGFSFAPYLPFILLLVGTGFGGTLVGKRLLDTFSEAFFMKLLNGILTVLALRLLWVALADFL